jgi:hypothetical protein
MKAKAWKYKEVGGKTDVKEKNGMTRWTNVFFAEQETLNCIFFIEESLYITVWNDKQCTEMSLKIHLDISV